ncbi:MAG: zf-HC2 domain-containing protein [Gemmatimonadales bacterium]|nr:zf-HC2 domain-containing protein [Gemmatimonadales bacterium]
MNNNVPFDPRKEAPLLSAYVDGELDPGNTARLEAHLKDNPETRNEIEQLLRLKNLTRALRLKIAPPEEWEVFWHSVYNRSERSLGWILLTLGLSVAGGWFAWLILQSLLSTESLPLLVKGAIIVGIAGTLVLMVSVVRERIFKRNRTRYKDVIR